MYVCMFAENRAKVSLTNTLNKLKKFILVDKCSSHSRSVKIDKARNEGIQQRDERGFLHISIHLVQPAKSQRGCYAGKTSGVYRYTAVQTFYQLKASGKVVIHMPRRFQDGEMNGLCSMARKMIISDAMAPLYCFRHKRFSRWCGLMLSTEEKKPMSIRSGGKLNVREEELFEIESVLLFYTRAAGHCHLGPKAKKPDYSAAMEQAIHFCQTER